MSRISRETMHAICRDIKVTRPATHNEKHGMVYISAWAGAHPKPLQAYADMYRYFLLQSLVLSVFAEAWNLVLLP